MDEVSHTNKAQHHEKFLQFVKDNDSKVISNFPDWVITIAFYVALQYVDAKLAKFNQHPAMHQDRNTLVAKYLPQLSRNYFVLKGKSEFARYIPNSEKLITPTATQILVNMALAFK